MRVDTENKHLSLITGLTKPYMGEYLSAPSLWQTAPDPRPDKDSDRAFIPQDWIVTLKIIWHWRETVKSRSKRPFQFEMKVMTAVFILKCFMQSRICRLERCKLICVFVCTQLGWLVINCARRLQMQADLSADFNSQSQCINWGRWVQVLGVLLRVKWKMKSVRQQQES